MTALRQQVLEAIARVSGKEVSTVLPEHDLAVDLGLDSPQILHLLVELESRLEIEIGDEEAERLRTVADVVDYVERHGV